MLLSKGWTLFVLCICTTHGKTTISKRQADRGQSLEQLVQLLRTVPSQSMASPSNFRSSYDNVHSLGKQALPIDDGTQRGPSNDVLSQLVALLGTPNRGPQPSQSFSNAPFQSSKTPAYFGGNDAGTPWTRPQQQSAPQNGLLEQLQSLLGSRVQQPAFPRQNNNMNAIDSQDKMLLDSLLLKLPGGDQGYNENNHNNLMGRVNQDAGSSPSFGTSLQGLYQSAPQPQSQEMNFLMGLLRDTKQNNQNSMLQDAAINNLSNRVTFPTSLNAPEMGFGFQENGKMQNQWNGDLKQGMQGQSATDTMTAMNSNANRFGPPSMNSAMMGMGNMRPPSNDMSQNSAMMGMGNMRLPSNDMSQNSAMMGMGNMRPPSNDVMSQINALLNMNQPMAPSMPAYNRQNGAPNQLAGDVDSQALQALFAFGGNQAAEQPRKQLGFGSNNFNMPTQFGGNNGQSTMQNSPFAPSNPAHNNLQTLLGSLGLQQPNQQQQDMGNFGNLGNYNQGNFGDSNSMQGSPNSPGFSNQWDLRMNNQQLAPSFTGNNNNNNNQGQRGQQGQNAGQLPLAPQGKFALGADQMHALMNLGFGTAPAAATNSLLDSRLAAALSGSGDLGKFGRRKRRNA